MNPKGWRLAGAVAVSVVSVFLVTSVWAGTVTSLNDGGPGSLRQAIADAVSGETIDFAVTGTITLTSGELSIDKDLTITGPGESQLTINGNNNSRVFYVGTFTVTISGLTITEGYTNGNAGGIFNLAGTLTLTNCTVSGNNADAAAGGIYNLFGTLSLTNCTVSGNNAHGSYGGGIYNLGGTLTLTNCSVSGNTAGNDGGGIDNYDGNATLAGCTISGNSATGHRDGGIEHYEGTMTLTNCTVSGNTAAIGGGIHDFYQNTTLTNCTVSGNTAVAGGGIAAQQEGVVSFKNTIIADNSDTNGAPDCWVDPIGTYTLKSYGFSLVEDTSGCRISEEANPGTDITGQDPNLGPLQNNGGSTETQALLEGSPAIEAALDCTLIDGTSPVTEDQRGVSRPQGDYCDIGAYESPAGACCFDDESCQVLFETECISAGGTYQGDVTDCGGGTCSQAVPPPLERPLTTTVPTLSPFGDFLFVLVLGVLGTSMVLLRKRKG